MTTNITINNNQGSVAMMVPRMVQRHRWSHRLRLPFGLNVYFTNCRMKKSPVMKDRDYQGRTYESVPRVASTVPTGKKCPRSIIPIKKEHESTVLHPTQKPVELIRYLIRTYTNSGGVVLDNCIGSGTTAVAAIKEHRHYIGFELDKGYYDTAVERIEELRRNPTLF